MWVVGLNILFQGKVFQRSVRSDLVVNPFSIFENLIESWQFLNISGINLVKLFCMSAMGTFHIALQRGEMG
jgi:hypothetical protein